MPPSNTVIETGAVEIDSTEAPASTLPLRLSHVSWKTYSRLLRAFEDVPGVRLTYDRGELEIMSPSFRHDRRGHLLNRFVCAITEELDLPVVGGRSTTLRRRAKQRGLEPDDCFWIASADQVGEKERIDLSVDPPPDLAIEVDETNSSLDRMGIYESLKVPEVWRIEGSGITFLELTDSGYVAIERSRAFPFLTPADLLAFLHEGMRTRNENPVVRKLKEWVRRQGGPLQE